jgi:hypothetical protein
MAISISRIYLQKRTKIFYVCEFSKLTSSYDDLIVILPNILGTKLPTSLKKLGRFTASGTANVSTTAVEADFYMVTH